MLGKQLLSLSFRNTKLFSKRNAGGFLKKNLYVEENAGLRENGYKTWEFDGNNLTSIFFLLVLPATLLTFTAMDEMKIRDKQINKKREYGLLPKQM